jgi:uncharacterized RDD family membrane protein YckC
MPAKLVPISPLVSLVIIIPLVVFWLWMFEDMIRNRDLPGEAKQTWVFVFVLLNVFGAVIYFATVYRNRS